MRTSTFSMEIDLTSVKIIINEALRYWWIVSPIVLFFILEELWLSYKKTQYISQLHWILLEVRLPRQVKRVTKAMEHVLNALHVIQTEPTKKDIYFEGKIAEWYSLEIVGRNGTIHFYIYMADKFRNLVEAQIYAQYPEAEINEVEDYTQSFPILPNGEYDVWGSELAMVKNEPLPIKTYAAFEHDKDEKSSDALAPLLEVLSALKDGEQIWIQFLIKPTDGKAWKEEAKKLIDKLAKRDNGPAPTKGGIINSVDSVFSGLGDVLGGVSGGASSGGEEKKKEEKKTELTPGEKNVIEAVERNVAQLGYETQIRFLYTAPASVFSRTQIAAILGSFRQFNTLNMNGFKLDSASSLNARWPNKDAKILSKKHSLFKKYAGRQFSQKKNFVLSTEELATLYHFPTALISAPSVIHLEAKKSEPPPTLPLLN